MIYFLASKIFMALALHGNNHRVVPAICPSGSASTFHGHTRDTLFVFPFPSPRSEGDGQFMDALKIRVVTRTVRQAHRIEDPAALLAIDRNIDGNTPRVTRTRKTD